MDIRLNPELVDTVFRDCLFADGADTSNYVPAHGIQINVGFDPERIAYHKDTVRALLLELPDEFMVSKGGGMSFLNACNDRHGNLWTGMHRTMEQLFLLGLACELVTELLPREAWDVLPGGMPYYAVRDMP